MSNETRAASLLEALSAEAFAAAANVPTTAQANLRHYAQLLRQWQRSINLVATRSLNDLWRRHMLDSAQLLPLLPKNAKCLADLGSGAGFPGLVLAMLGVPEVHLIEADTRKCVFLTEAARACGLEPGRNPIIHQARIEDLDGWPADVVTARGCARLDMLLNYASRFVSPTTACLFLKGKNIDSELTEAMKNWRMTVERIASRSDPSGSILRLGQIARADR